MILKAQDLQCEKKQFDSCMHGQFAGQFAEASKKAVQLLEKSVIDMISLLIPVPDMIGQA